MKAAVEDWSERSRDLAQLLARSAIGDRAAFRALYDRTSAHLYAVLLRIQRDRAQAEDLLQEVYVNVWRAVGGFDAAYFMYFEDVDLGERLGRAGWQNVYVPSAAVVHTGGHATTREPSRMAAEHHRSAWTYLSRRYPGWRWAPVRWVLRAGLAARAVLARRVLGGCA